MASVTVKDLDFGFRKAIRTFKVASRRFRVGISDPRVARYAAILEAKFFFIRETFDRLAPEPGFNKEMRALLDTIHAGKNPEIPQVVMLRFFAKQVRKRIRELELIDTGDMIRSVKVLEKKQ